MGDPKADALAPEISAEEGKTQPAGMSASLSSRRFRSLAAAAMVEAKTRAKQNASTGKVKLYSQMTNMRVVGTKRERYGFACMIVIVVCVVIAFVVHTANKYFNETISAVDFQLVDTITYPVLWACMEWSQVENLRIQGTHDSNSSFSKPCPLTSEPQCELREALPATQPPRDAQCIFATNMVKRVSDNSSECIYWRRGTALTEELERWMVRVVPARFVEDTFMCVVANEERTIMDDRENPLFAYLEFTAQAQSHSIGNILGNWALSRGNRLHLTGYQGVAAQGEARTLFKKTTMGLFNVQNVVDITMDTLNNRSVHTNDYSIRSSSNEMFLRVGNREEDRTVPSEIEFKTSSFVVRTVTLRRKYFAELAAEFGGIFSFVSIFMSMLYVREGVIYSRIPGQQLQVETAVAGTPAPAAPAPVKSNGWLPFFGGGGPSPAPAGPVFGDVGRVQRADTQRTLEDTTVASHVTPVWVWRWCGEEARFQKARDFALEELPELMPETEMSKLSSGNVAKNSRRDLEQPSATELSKIPEGSRSKDSLPNSWK